MQIHKGIIVLSLICLVFTNETNSISQTDLFRELLPTWRGYIWNRTLPYNIQ